MNNLTDFLLSPGSFPSPGPKRPAAEKALVLFSGGQDSTTALLWALNRFAEVETVGFAYGQRHQAELTQRPVILKALSELGEFGQKLKADHTVNLTESFQSLPPNALMSADQPIKTGTSGLPTSFVPGRNLLFFTYAAAVAYQRGQKFLIGGMCETDYSGYPDCRDDTLKALQTTLNLGTDKHFVIETPLMWLDKAETFALACTLGGEKALEIILELTHSCYLGNRQTRHDFGYGCGECPACILRRDGYRKFLAEFPLFSSSFPLKGRS